MNQKILIIDDDNHFRPALAMALEEEGFQVKQASSVSRGLEILNSDPTLQVLILDLAFPGEKGTVILDKLKENSSKYRIIVYTQWEELLEDYDAINLKAFNYLPKVDKITSLKFAIKLAFQDIESENRINKHLEILRMMDEKGQELEALERICTHSLELTNGYTCHIRLLDFQKGDYEKKAYAGPPQFEEIFTDNKKLNESFSGRVAKEGKSTIYNDLQNDKEFKEFKERIYHELSAKAREYLDKVKSSYIIPIKTRLFDNEDQVDAVLNISSSEKDFFKPEKVRTVDDFISHVNIAISKYWLKAKREEIHKDYKESNDLLVQVSEKIQESDINKVFDVVLYRISEILNAEMVSIFLRNETTNQVENRAEYVNGDITYNNEESYSPGECLTGYVFESGLAKLSNDPTNDPQYKSDTKMDVKRFPSGRLEHYLGIPLKVGDKVIGVIRANNKKSSYYNDENILAADNKFCFLTRGFSRDCETILGLIANHLAVTIKNNEKIEQLKSLSRNAQRISSNYGLETKNLYKKIVEETAYIMNAAICMLFLKDKEDKQIVLEECEGMPKIEDAFYNLDESYFTAQVAKNEVPRRGPGVENYKGKYDKEILASLKEKYGEETEINSFMIVPILIWDDSPARENTIIGVLKVINKKNDTTMFDEDELELFRTFASQIGVAFVMSERNKSLFKLAQGVGHEIDNTISLVAPFAKILSKKATQFLNDNSENTNIINIEAIETIKSNLESIYEATAEARDFTQDLLGFSESRFIKKELVDINDLVRDEIKKFLDAPPPNARNTSDVLLNFSELYADAPKLNIYKIPFAHVIRNIVANAYQAMEDREKNSLTIRTYLKTYETTLKKAFCIEITDTGKGIEEGNLSQIFDSGYSKRAGGNGLGLWLAKITLLRMDGLIQAKSTLNKGTTFLMELPITSQGESFEE